MYSCIHQNDLIDMESLRDIDVLVNFESTDKSTLRNMQAQVQVMPY